MRILSIDAWGNQDDGYEWNQWYYIGDTQSCDTKEQCIDALIDAGYVARESRGVALQTLELEDDHYNAVLCDRVTGRPLYAFEYGAAI